MSELTKTDIIINRVCDWIIRNLYESNPVGRWIIKFWNWLRGQL